MGPQVVAEEEVPPVRRGTGRAEIEMMVGEIGRGKKGFSSRDAQIAFRHVADSL
jgi:hypothetical protein